MMPQQLTILTALFNLQPVEITIIISIIGLLASILAVYVKTRVDIAKIQTDLLNINVHLEKMDVDVTKKVDEQRFIELHTSTHQVIGELKCHLEQQMKTSAEQVKKIYDWIVDGKVEVKRKSRNHKKK